MREILAFAWAAIFSMWISAGSWISSLNVPVEEQRRFHQPGIFVGPIAPKRVFTSDERRCLAQNIYFEARNQTASGQLAVAMVVLNRTEDPFWPNDVCSVVKQGSYITGYVGRHQCQFSWYCDGLSDRPADSLTWNMSLELADQAIVSWLNDEDITEGATNYHSVYVDPVWRNDRGMKYIKEIGNHKFYFWQRSNVAIL